MKRKYSFRYLDKYFLSRETHLFGYKYRNKEPQFNNDKIYRKNLIAKQIYNWTKSTNFTLKNRSKEFDRLFLSSMQYYLIYGFIKKNSKIIGLKKLKPFWTFWRKTSKRINRN